jgi:mRNA-degrading endonuclease RelE of RelBE toxin-antitoxin system
MKRKKQGPPSVAKAPTPTYVPMLAQEHWEALKRLPNDSQREKATAFLFQYVLYTPRKRLPNGDLKELHGEHKGIWQFDIDPKYRILYTIDDDAKQVNVQYIGNHPGWGRRSSGRQGIKT